MQRNELIVVHGTNPAAMAREALAAARIEELIPQGALIALKPNLVVSKDASSGAVTHPEIVEGAVSYLREKGFSRFVVMEGSWVGDATSRAFGAAGYRTLSERIGVPLVDLQKDSWKRYDAGGGMKIAVCDAAMAAGFMINLPVLKGHCQTTVTCALKNLKGCMSDDEKSRFHQLGLHEPIARLNRVLKPGFILADGICGDLDFEEGGNPVQMNRLVAALDPVLMDAYACRLMGHDIEDVPYIGLAEEYGVGSADLSAAKISELGRRQSAPAIPPARAGQGPGFPVDEKSACSACYAALIHGWRGWTSGASQAPGRGARRESTRSGSHRQDSKPRLRRRRLRPLRIRSARLGEGLPPDGAAVPNSWKAHLRTIAEPLRPRRPGPPGGSGRRKKPRIAATAAASPRLNLGLLIHIDIRE
jgi:uncharacterized protein (DUF362 family)